MFARHYEEILQLACHRKWFLRSGFCGLLITDLIPCSIPYRNIGEQVMRITCTNLDLIDVDFAFILFGVTSPCRRVWCFGRRRRWRCRGAGGWGLSYSMDRAGIGIYDDGCCRLVHHFGLFCHHGLDNIVGNDRIPKFREMEDSSNPGRNVSFVFILSGASEDLTSPVTLVR